MVRDIAGNLVSTAINESFGGWAYLSGTDWPDPIAGYVNMQPGFFGLSDWVGAHCNSAAACLTPDPIFDPDSTYWVKAGNQTWRAGSLTVGQGVVVQTNPITYFLGRGKHGI